MENFEQQQLLQTQLRNSSYSGALERIQNCTQLNANGILVQEPNWEDLAKFRELEDRKMVQLGNQISILICEKIYPWIYQYLYSLHKTQTEAVFDADGESFFQNLSANVYYNQTESRNVEGAATNREGDRLANFVFDLHKNTKEVGVFLEKLFENYPFSGEIDERGFEAYLGHALTHEMIHAMSTSSYMTSEEEMYHRNWLAIRNSAARELRGTITNVAYKVGLACRFPEEAGKSKELTYFSFEKAQSLNEGLTDIFTAIVWQQSNQVPSNEYYYPYPVAYKGEAKAVHKAIKFLADEWGESPKKVFRRVEEAFFFGNTERQTYLSVLLSLLAYYEPPKYEIPQKQIKLDLSQSSVIFDR